MSDVRQYVAMLSGTPACSSLFHNHSINQSLCGYGFILVTCKEVYDKLVHYTNDEYKTLTRKIVDVQAELERPYIHLLVVGSSSASDHIAFTADRVECVKALDISLQAPDGTHIMDKLRFFNGDKVVQWIEGGYQDEGNYKCGCCGVRSESFIDCTTFNNCTFQFASLPAVSQATDATVLYHDDLTGIDLTELFDF